MSISHEEEFKAFARGYFEKDRVTRESLGSILANIDVFEDSLVTFCERLREDIRRVERSI